MSATYVRCRVLRGLFDTEFYVLVNGSAMYVARQNVRVAEEPGLSGEVDGTVLAYVVAEQGGRTLIELPGEPVVGGLRNWVETSQLAHP